MVAAVGTIWVVAVVRVVLLQALLHLTPERFIRQRLAAVRLVELAAAQVTEQTHLFPAQVYPLLLQTAAVLVEHKVELERAVTAVLAVVVLGLVLLAHLRGELDHKVAMVVVLRVTAVVAVAVALVLLVRPIQIQPLAVRVARVIRQL